MVRGVAFRQGQMYAAYGVGLGPEEYRQERRPGKMRRFGSNAHLIGTGGYSRSAARSFWLPACLLGKHGTGKNSSRTFIQDTVGIGHFLHMMSSASPITDCISALRRDRGCGFLTKRKLVRDWPICTSDLKAAWPTRI